MGGLDSIAPVVLVGGRSRRFGRDKLREPVGGGRWLVDGPVAALRGVFGARVLLCGACDASVAARGDGVIEDRYPGAGPLGGIVSALAWCAGGGRFGGVFVLAGDLAGIESGAVLRVLGEAERARGALAVVARTERVQPCIGLYRVEALAPLEAWLAGGSARLTEAAASLGEGLATCEIDGRAGTNINTRAEMEGFASRERPGAG